MITLKTILALTRPKTLLLSSSGVIVGYSVAGFDSQNFLLFIGCLLTASILQILSNFANDYGDFKKGTDNDNRLGEKRALQKGEVSSSQLKMMIYLVVALALITGTTTIILAPLTSAQTYLFLLLGILAVVAAIGYTTGKLSYGYKGLGDLFVFIFFGLISVNGTSIITNGVFNVNSILQSVIIGLLAVAVLNLNNMRDIENDAYFGKNTLAVKLGSKRVLHYHYSLIFIAGLGIVFYPFLGELHPAKLISYLPILLLIFHLKKIQKNPEPQTFDGELKWITLSAFSYSLLIITSTLLIE